MPLDFDTLYRAELPYVVRTLRRLAVSEANLDDAAHEMLVDVYEKLHLYDGSRPLRPWLFGFAYRVARDFRRRTERRRTDSLDEHAHIHDEGELPEDLVERQQKQRLAVRCLAALPEDQAAVLILHALDDVSIPEVARTLSIPLNTAYSRLRLARRAFDAAACQHAPKDNGR